MPKPDYGIDAPGLVRMMFLAGVVAVGLTAVAALSTWPGGMVARVFGLLTGLAAAYFLGMGLYMIYGSKVEKVRDRDRLMDLVSWSGVESVLDVGCGRGLMLVAAAKRMPHGLVTGVDLWLEKDQANNRPEAALANARIEGVESRVNVRTADMRSLPFPDGSFDLVVSHWAVHNLAERADRSTALNEMARVLKPGGRVILADIENQSEYVDRFQDLRFEEVRHVVSKRKDAILNWLTFGSFRPSVVMGRKPVPSP